MVIRALDVVISLSVILILSPLLIPVMLLLRVTGEGEIWYRQERVGLSGQTFKILKFATMLKNSPSIGSRTITQKNDSRVLPVGRWLRKYKVNELPQFINVFVGDMSLVGPRPLTREVFDLYSVRGQKKIASIKPGLTGVGSIFFRDEESFLGGAGDNLHAFYRENVSPRKERLEIWYDENKSIKTYFLVLFATAIVVLNSRFDSVAFLRRFIGELPEGVDIHEV